MRKTPHLSIDVTEDSREDSRRGYHNYSDIVTITYGNDRPRVLEDADVETKTIGVLLRIDNWMWFRSILLMVAKQEDGPTTVTYKVTYGYDSGD